MDEKRGSLKAIQEIVKVGNRLNVQEVAKISSYVKEVGGDLVAIDSSGDDDWCGTGHFRIKWPPRNTGTLNSLIEMLVAERIDFEVLVNGIPVPEEILMRVSRMNRF